MRSRTRRRIGIRRRSKRRSKIRHLAKMYTLYSKVAAETRLKKIIPARVITKFNFLPILRLRDELGMRKGRSMRSKNNVMGTGAGNMRTNDPKVCAQGS